MDFKQSETKKNLMRAFAGESQARNRYIFAAAQAEKTENAGGGICIQVYCQAGGGACGGFLSAFEGAFGGNGSH